jgi:hypothetical protein
VANLRWVLAGSFVASVACCLPRNAGRITENPWLRHNEAMRTRARVCLVVFVALIVAGCGGGGGMSALGGHASFAVSAAAGSNVSLDPPPVTLVVGYEGREVGAFSYGPPQDGFQMKLWQLDIGFGAIVMAGQTFVVVAAPATGADTTMLATISLQEDPASGGFREWAASGGSVQILSRVGDTAAVALTATGFQPTTGGSGNEATGSFTLTGQITVENVNQALPAD